jgi:hypothetical protein
MRLLAPAILFFVDLAVFLPVFVEPTGADLNDQRIRWSAVAPVIAWPFAAAGLAAKRRDARWLYSVGAITAVMHVAVAFHLGHDWSHAEAVERTRQTSGVGGGVWVNYVFVVLWLVDVAWTWIGFDSYHRRPVWVTVAVFGFQAFILVNAAVIFAAGPMRWINLAVLALPWQRLALSRRVP